MKRLSLFLLFLVVLSLAAYSAVYRSNGLGQKLEAKESLENLGFELLVQDDTETLYEGGVPSFVLTRLADGYEKKQGDLTERVFTDEKGKPQRRILTTSEKTEEYNYFYEDRLLSSYNYSLDGEVLRTVRYLRTKEGTLLGFEDEEGLTYLSSRFFVYEEDGKAVLVDPFQEDTVEALPERLVEENPDGGYTEILGEKSRTYDGNGRLVEEKETEKRILYSYGEDGGLVSIRTEESSSILVTEYVDGKAARTLEYDEREVLKTISTILPDGTIEEIRYVDGVPRYRFVFDRDGKRVREASGL
ncbi:MAG: hypothetical protein KBS81_03645 [Spirochaetales bacterium]|nr:hypothetical protein [Candidatus Physcosoma equi]